MEGVQNYIRTLRSQNKELKKDNQRLAISVKKMADAPEERRIEDIRQQYQNDITSIKQLLAEKSEQNILLKQQLEKNGRLLAQNETVIARL